MCYLARLFKAKAAERAKNPYPYEYPTPCTGCRCQTPPKYARPPSGVLSKRKEAKKQPIANPYGPWTQYPQSYSAQHGYGGYRYSTPHELQSQRTSRNTSPASSTTFVSAYGAPVVSKNTSPSSSTTFVSAYGAPVMSPGYLNASPADSYGYPSSSRSPSPTEYAGYASSEHSPYGYSSRHSHSHQPSKHKPRTHGYESTSSFRSRRYRDHGYESASSERVQVRPRECELSSSLLVIGELMCLDSKIRWEVWDPQFRARLRLEPKLDSRSIPMVRFSDSFAGLLIAFCID
jgi:hypothetical protein